MEDTTQSNGGTQWTNQSVEERGKLMRSLVERGLQMYQVFGVPEGKSKEAMEEIRKGSEEHGFVPAEGDEALWAWRKDTKEFQRSQQKQITMDVWMSAWPGKAEGGVIESKRVEAWTGAEGGGSRTLLLNPMGLRQAESVFVGYLSGLAGKMSTRPIGERWAHKLMAAVVDSDWAKAAKVWIFPYFLLHDEVWVMKVLAGDEETAKVLKERMGEGMDINTGEVSFRVVANYERDTETEQ